MEKSERAGYCERKERTREAHRSEVVNPTIIDENDDEEMKDEAPARKSRARSQPQGERSHSPPQKTNEKPEDIENRSRSPLQARKNPKDCQPATAVQPYNLSIRLLSIFCKPPVLDGPEAKKVDKETVDTEAMGDWNLTPCDQRIWAFLPANTKAHFVGNNDGSARSMRWEGDRCACETQGRKELCQRSNPQTGLIAAEYNKHVLS